MALRVDAAGLKKTRWYEYVVRFGFGGAVTARRGLLGHYFGPPVGGLFLAFPAILPAALTLVEEHDGRTKAADDAAGAACGAVGLVAFAAAVWVGAGRLHVAVVLGAAMALWLLVSVLCWRLLAGAGRR